jgi:hypothetical protein
MNEEARSTYLVMTAALILFHTPSLTQRFMWAWATERANTMGIEMTFQVTLLL